MEEFNEKYRGYTAFMQTQFDLVKDHNDFDSFQDANPKDMMAPSDFHRYKSHNIMSKRAYWNSQVEMKKIRKQLTKKINKQITKGK